MFYKICIRKHLFDVASICERANRRSPFGFSLFAATDKNDLDVNNHIKRNSFLLGLRKIQETHKNCNRLPQNQTEAKRSMNLLGQLNTKLFDFNNDYCP